MLTKYQMLKSGRKKKVFRSKTPHLRGCPQKKGYCVKIFHKTPKKPNSAVRKVVRVMLTTGKATEAYIPGEGHTLQVNAVVLLRGGRVPDLPGVKYHLIRGSYDLEGLSKRRNSRSKYGTKKKRIGL